jgi:hypothetical protein
MPTMGTIPLPERRTISKTKYAKERSKTSSDGKNTFSVNGAIRK